MLTRTLLSLALLLILFPENYSQHYIGETKEQVRKLMSKQRGLREDKSARNPAFNMIKYTDLFQNQTLIYVFDDDDRCKYSKHMCDYSMLDKMKAKLDEQYTAVDDSTWTYRHEGSAYTVTMKKDEWYFIIDTRKAEK